MPVKSIRKFSSVLFLLLFFIFLISSIRYIFNSTVLAPQYFIQDVKYDSGSVGSFDDPVLYSDISKALKGKNYYITRYLNMNNTFKTIYDKYPFIQDISLFFLENNTVAVSLSFLEPSLIVYAGEKRFAVYKNIIVPLFPQNQLGSKIQSIKLSDYSSGLDNIDGLFFRVGLEKLISDLNILESYLKKPYEIVYLGGADKSIVETADGKQLYFNHLTDIPFQLEKLDLLKNNYEGFDTLYQINLGSIESRSVIVRR